MPRTRIVGLNEEQLIHALSIDDAYHVERTLVESHGKGVTERVTMEGSGPFVRKKIPLNLANRAVWAVLQECDSLRLPRVALTYELPDCFVAVYDFVPGNTLESLVAARGRLPVDEAVQAVQDVCEALESAAAHVAAQDQATPRESRVHAALKIGLLSVAVVAALSGVLILNVSTCARLAEGFGGNSAATSQGGIANGASGNAAEEDAVAEAAQAGVEEGLKRGSNLPSFESGESSNADVEAAFDALSIADSGWSVDSSGYVNYAFLLKSEEDGFRVLFPTVKITGRDASGKVLFSHEQVLPAINPGETVCYGFVAGNGTPPEDVEFVVARPDDYNISKHAAESPKFEVSAASAVPDGFGGANFTGEVAYLGGVLPSVSMGGVAVTVVLRDDAGKIVYGATTHTDCPAEGESTTFEILGGKLPPYDSIEAYAQAW